MSTKGGHQLACDGCGVKKSAIQECEAEKPALDNTGTPPAAPPPPHTHTWHAPSKHVPEPPTEVVHTAPLLMGLHWPSAPQVWHLGWHSPGVVLHVGCGNIQDGRDQRKVTCTYPPSPCHSNPGLHACANQRTRGGWHTSVLQKLDSQSVSPRHDFATGQSGQVGPPQSTSVSSPFLVPSSQRGGCRGQARCATAALLVASVAAAGDELLCMRRHRCLTLGCACGWAAGRTTPPMHPRLPGGCMYRWLGRSAVTGSRRTPGTAGQSRTAGSLGRHSSDPSPGHSLRHLQQVGSSCSVRNHHTVQRRGSRAGGDKR